MCCVWRVWHLTGWTVSKSYSSIPWFEWETTKAQQVSVFLHSHRPRPILHTCKYTYSQMCSHSHTIVSSSLTRRLGAELLQYLYLKTSLDVRESPRELFTHNHRLTVVLYRFSCHVCFSMNTIKVKFPMRIRDNYCVSTLVYIVYTATPPLMYHRSAHKFM